MRIAFGPIASAICLRRLANSFKRFASSKTGAGGVTRIAGVSGAFAALPIDKGQAARTAKAVVIKTGNSRRVILFICTSEEFLMTVGIQSLRKLAGDYGLRRRFGGATPGGNTRVRASWNVTTVGPSGRRFLRVAFGKIRVGVSSCVRGTSGG